MEIEFTKMHGLGNDFVLIDALQEKVNLSQDQAKNIANRRFGIGCDQILIIEPGEPHGADIFYRILNADGSEVSQCGNGARCVAAYLHRNKIITRREIIAATANGSIRLEYNGDENITVDMGIPVLEPSGIPINLQPNAGKYTLDIEGGTLEISSLSMGNPHAVISVDDIDIAPLATLGPIIQQSECFPEGVNVGFMQISSRKYIKLRVYERGSGETLACGSGACAAVVAGYMDDKLDNEVEVELPGGILSIFWKGVGNPVLMTGPATFVYKGRIVI